MWSPGTEVVANYAFKKGNRDDLQFEKGDTLVVVAKTSDSNWVKAKDNRGNTGLIPVNYVVKRSEIKKETVHLHKMPWFHGKIDRNEAEELLKLNMENGLFLVRESTNYPGDFTLCVWYTYDPPNDYISRAIVCQCLSLHQLCFDEKVEHYRVMYQADKLTVDEESSFSNLTQLVEHYEKTADGLISELRKPLLKKGSMAVSVDADLFKKSGWNIPRRHVDLVKIVGHGEFGDVWEAKYNQKRVAVKSLKEEGRSAQTFLTEASVMTGLDHKNLVRLLGVSLDSSPIYLITEFCDKGSLVEYLRSRGRAVITKKDLIGFARDVAEGMCYLESQHFVHRDLAARNVLLDENCMAKVADFGHAREVNVSVSGKLPIKWTAPEALRDSKFSSKSDVWSYSVFLWEIYSFGRVPYPRVPLTEVLSRVVNGYRMECPEACSKRMFAVMTECWAIFPRERPPFKNILAKLKTFKDDE